MKAVKIIAFLCFVFIIFASASNVFAFEDLKKDISGLKTGETLNLNRDYCYNTRDNYKFGDNSAIWISKDNVTINGNGHVISGNNKALIFKVAGNNVKIHNVTFIDAKFDIDVYKNENVISTKKISYNAPCINPHSNHYNDQSYDKNYNKHEFKILDESGESALRWYGNNGVLSGCTFIGNTAFNGGAVSWFGNNGLITDCIFLNNTARGVGGAIYINGINNTFSRLKFVNSYSSLVNESVFLDHDNENCTITDCLPNTCHDVIDARLFNLSVNLHPFKDTIVKKKINLIPLIAKATIENRTLNYNNDISYSVVWNNSSCLFNINSKLRNGIVKYYYQFKGVSVLGDVFDKLLAKNYVKSFELNVTVNNADEYKDIFNYKDKNGYNILNITVNAPLSIYNLYSDCKSFNEINLNNVGTFNELASLIHNLHSGDVLNLTKNYYFNENIDRNVVINVNNVTINGNAYVIDGMNKHAVFEISGNNVNLFNMTFMNALNNQFNTSTPNAGNSFISWKGDNGVLLACTFIDNVALNGGSVKWMGNKGYIVYCTFINNTADLGGAVYVSGLKNTIHGSYFENCYSQLVYEAIFAKCGIENCNISSCSFNNVIPVFDKLLTCDMGDNASTFDEFASLVKNLHPGDVINLTKDYYFNESSNIIKIKVDNVTINGNGHIINGMNKSVLFNVVGNNVKIYNLTFINVKDTYDKIIGSSDAKNISYTRGRSAVCWFGDGGVLSDCNFFGNAAVNGGALTWMGNKGVINRCIFINNTASGVGGAIYNTGVNNTIINTIFRDSTSLLTCEAIFVGMGYKNFNISRCMNNNKIFVMDGNLSGINVEYLHYNAFHNICGENINLIPLIYKSIMFNSAFKYNENISYGFSYINNTFLFSINGKLNNGDYLINYEYYFKNVTFYNNTVLWDKVFADVLLGLVDLNVSNNNDWNIKFGIFKMLNSFIEFKFIEANYTKSILVVKNVCVKNNDDYFSLCHLKKSLDIKYLSQRGIDVSDADFALNVTFAGNLTIKATEIWKVHDGGYNVVNVNGQNSKIIPLNGFESSVWVSIAEDDFFTASNLIVDGFHCIVENKGGICIFDEISFKNAYNNDLNRGFGGAILNQGLCYCTNCYFYHNFAKFGGAVFNTGAFIFRKCIFEDNYVYKKGPDICDVDGGNHIYDSKLPCKVIEDGEFRIINGENINDSKVYCCNHLDSDSLVEKTFFSSAISFFTGFVTGFVVGICTLNPVAGAIAGVAAGATVGAITGAFTSLYLENHNYDPNYQSGKTYAIVMGVSIASGVVGGILGGYVSTAFYATESVASSATESVSSSAMESVSSSAKESFIEGSELYEAAESYVNGLNVPCEVLAKPAVPIKMIAGQQVQTIVGQAGTQYIVNLNSVVNLNSATASSSCLGCLLSCLLP